MRSVAIAALTFFLSVMPASAKVSSFIANLNGGQETPPSMSVGLGVGYFAFDSTTKMLCASITYANLTSAEVAAHIHGPAAPGVAAPILIPFAVGNAKQECHTLTSDQQKFLKKDLLYFNVHTTNNPGGEIRGQIVGAK